MEHCPIVTVTPPGNLTVVDEVDEDEYSNLSKFALLAPPSEGSRDEIKAMLGTERDHYRPPRNYLNFESCRGGVNENWRRRLCEWMFEVTDHYDFDREVVSFAFDYLDRSISLSYGPNSSKKLSKREYQLYAVTSLYLAIKVHGEMDSEVHGKRIKLRISAFQELSRGCFKTETIEAKELEFLCLFGWRVNPPTCARFIYSLLRLLPEWTPTKHGSPREDIVCQIFDVAKYLTELSIFDSDFTFYYEPSKISYAAILCAIEYIEESTKGITSDITVRFLLNIKEVSSNLVPESEDIWHLQTMLKKLAPKMFTNHKWHNPLPRTVSLLEVDPAKSAGASSRSISPIVMGGNGPKTKRQRV